MPALAKTAMRAPASACATDARPPKASPSSAVQQRPAGRNAAVVARQRRGPPALVLGPLAVDPACRKLGVGAALMRHALAAAAGARPWRGDPARRRALLCPLRLLRAQDRRAVAARARSSATACSASNCAEGALDGAWGMIAPTGAAAPKAGPPRRALRSRRARPDRRRHGRPVHPARCPEPARPDHRHDPGDHARGHDRPGHLRAPLGHGRAVASDVTQRPVSRGGCAPRQKPVNRTKSSIEVLMSRRLISTGSPFEKTAGYSRAVIDGDFAFVAGTTGYDYATMTMPADVTSQTRNCFKTIEAALERGRLRDGRHRPRHLLRHRRQGRRRRTSRSAARFSARSGRRRRCWSSPGSTSPR